jgi:hypothetical protein
LPDQPEIGWKWEEDEGLKGRHWEALVDLG